MGLPLPLALVLLLSGGASPSRANTLEAVMVVPARAFGDNNRTAEYSRKMIALSAFAHRHGFRNCAWKWHDDALQWNCGGRAPTIEARRGFLSRLEGELVEHWRGMHLGLWLDLAMPQTPPAQRRTDHIYNVLNRMTPVSSRRGSESRVVRYFIQVPNGLSSRAPFDSCHLFSQEICQAYREVHPGRPLDLETFYLAKTFVEMEGRWNPKSKRWESHRDEYSFGLMQLLDSTARDVAGRLTRQRPPLDPSLIPRLVPKEHNPDRLANEPALTDVMFNLRLGMKYMTEKLDYCARDHPNESRIQCAAACYNAGGLRYDMHGDRRATHSHDIVAAVTHQSFMDHCQFRSIEAACGGAAP